MDLKIAISSRKIGYSITYPVIVKSLLDSGVPPHDIYFFIGGSDETGSYVSKEGVNCVKVNHNSIDYTALIGVLDLNLKADYWFLLHDTCKAGPNFYKIIKEYDYNNIQAVALRYRVSMNIGAYSWDYLQTIKNELLNFKNTDLSEESIQKWKAIGVENEDKFLSEYMHFSHYDSSDRMFSSPIDYYNTGTKRIIEYYPNADLYKIKANSSGYCSTYELNI